MISRKTFTNLIKVIRDQEEVHKGFTSAINQFFDGHSICTIADTAICGIIQALEDEMNDADAIISWWLWDAPNGGSEKSNAWVEDNGVRLPLETSEQLYDYLALSRNNKGTS